MQRVQLSAIDLNLLVVLDALLQTRSVKEAAGRVSLSASATSHALGRLRELFDDPLLVRAGRRMVLSARAEGLKPQVRTALTLLEALFSTGEPVEPRHLRRGFTVGTTDYGELMMMGFAARILAAEAPGVDLYCRRVDDIVEELRSGTVDLGVGVYRDIQPDVVLEPVFEERFVCLLRRDHPALERGLDLETYASLDHVLVSPGGTPTGIVDARLAEQGLQRRVARTVSSFVAAPHALVGTDQVLTIASRIAALYADLLGLAVVSPPLELPGFAISMVWHRRAQADPAHAWLRARVLAHGWRA